MHKRNQQRTPNSNSKHSNSIHRINKRNLVVVASEIQAAVVYHRAQSHKLPSIKRRYRPSSWIPTQIRVVSSRIQFISFSALFKQLTLLLSLPLWVQFRMLRSQQQLLLMTISRRRKRTFSLSRSRCSYPDYHTTLCVQHKFAPMDTKSTTSLCSSYSRMREPNRPILSSWTTFLPSKSHSTYEV